MTIESIIKQIENINNELKKEFSGYSRNFLESRKNYLESLLEKQKV
ncbi:MAG: hypothetical protein M0R03_08605 [Novosphingobium sp.]|nr:hypothetical protein [Novosphingobium sp.]